MTAPEAAFQAIAAELLQEPDVEEGTGFGTNPGLNTRGKIFAMIVRDGLVVKLPADRCAGLVSTGGAEPFVVGKRQMREWIRLAEVDEAEWKRLVLEARDYVRS